MLQKNRNLEKCGRKALFEGGEGEELGDQMSLRKHRPKSQFFVK
jgi:hypothetical protein